MTQPEQATFQVKYVNEIKPGKKFGNLKDSTDNLWWCDDPALFKNVQKGQTITVSYTKAKWSSGPVNVIEQILDEAPRTGGTEAPRVETQDETSCRIFVTGFLQQVFRGTGSFPGERELADMIYRTRCAWHTAMNAPLRPTPPAEKPKPLDPNAAPF